MRLTNEAKSRAYIPVLPFPTRFASFAELGPPRRSCSSFSRNAFRESRHSQLLNNCLPLSCSFASILFNLFFRIYIELISIDGGPTSGVFLFLYEWVLALWPRAGFLRSPYDTVDICGCVSRVENKPSRRQRDERGDFFQVVWKSYDEDRVIYWFIRS